MTTVTERLFVDVARHQETLARARAEETAGDEASAERGFREVLDATRGSGELVAFVALANLTGLYMRQGRESEVLILCRRLVEAAGAFEPFRGAWARQALCMALANIEDWPRLAEELPQFDAAIPGSPEPHATIFARSARALRVTVAIFHGTLEEARAAHAPLVASLDETAAPNTRRFVHLLCADIEQRAGRLVEALAAARLARPYAASPMEEVAGVVVEAECLLELEGREPARDLVRGLLDRIDASPSPTIRPAHLVKAGPRLAELVAEGLCDDALARRTYDLAAEAIVRRSSEIERAVADLPELAHPHPDDAASLAAFRARFRDEKRSFLRAVARMLGDRRGAAPFLRPECEDAVRVCAWCVRVHRRDGTWAPVGHLVDGDSTSRVTHGICEPCVAQLDASTRAA